MAYRHWPQATEALSPQSLQFNANGRTLKVGPGGCLRFTGAPQQYVLGPRYPSVRPLLLAA
jgi:hypothetical protein